VARTLETATGWPDKEDTMPQPIPRRISAEVARRLAALGYSLLMAPPSLVAEVVGQIERSQRQIA